MSAQINRREMLKLTLAGAAVLSTGMLAKYSYAATGTIRLEQCVAMSPEEIAKSSGKVMAAWEYLNSITNQINEPFLRARVLEILSNPAPAVVTVGNEKEILKALKAAGYVNPETSSFLPPVKNVQKSPQPFWSAPGSGWGSHHAYPGGLATHTAFNTTMADSMHANYVSIYNFKANRDIVLAAQILHDLHKPWVFQWQKDNACRVENSLAGTGEHHILSLAESIHRGLSPELVIAQAGAHNPPSTPENEAAVVNWLKAAAMVAGKDPIQLGLIAKDGKTLPLPRQTEAFITHVADHDYVLSVPCVQWLLPVLKNIAEKVYGIQGQDLEGKPFNNLRNYVFAQVTAMSLYHTYAQEKETGVEKVMLSLVQK